MMTVRGPMALPIDAQALSLPYEETAPLEVDGLVFNEQGRAHLVVNTASHLSMWLFGYSTHGDQPRRVFEVRSTGPGTGEQAYSTAGVALAAALEPHGLVLVDGQNRTRRRPIHEQGTLLTAVFAIERKGES